MLDRVKPVKPMDVFKRDYSNFDENTFLEDIATQDWSTDNNTNIYFNNFLTTLETCIDKHAPMKKLNRKQIKKLSKPWINNFILKLVSTQGKII